MNPLEEAAPAKGDAASASPKEPVDTSTMLRVLDLYPITLPQKASEGTKRCRGQARPSRQQTPTTGSAAAAPALSQAPQAPSVSPARSESLDVDALPTVNTYRSSPGQLQDRVAVALNQRLAALLDAKLRERRREIALADSLAASLRQRQLQQQRKNVSPSVAQAAPPGPSTRVMRGAAARKEHASSAQPTPAAATSAAAAIFTSSIGGTKRGAGPAHYPSSHTESVEDGSSEAPAQPSSEFLTKSLSGTYPAAAWRRPAPGGTQGLSVGEESTRPNYGAVELVRVHRLRGIPNHNRGLYAGPQTPAYTTRSGTMTLGLSGTGGKRVRPSAWGALWDQQTHDESGGERAGLKLRLADGVAGAGWLAQYDAQVDSKKARRVGGRLHGSSLVMRSFGSDGRTYFQWIQGSDGVGSAHPVTDGDEQATARRPSGVVGEGILIDRGLTLDLMEEDIDTAIDRVVSSKYGKPLSKEEREEALRRLHEKRKEHRGRMGAADGVPGEGGILSPHRTHTGIGDGTTLGGRSGRHTPLGRPDSSSVSFLTPHYDDVSVRPDSGLLSQYFSNEVGNGVPFDSTLEWGQLALPGVDGASASIDAYPADSPSPYSKGAVSTTIAFGLGDSLGRTLNIEEAERAAARQSRKSAERQRSGRGGKATRADADDNLFGDAKNEYGRRNSSGSRSIFSGSRTTEVEGMRSLMEEGEHSGVGRSLMRPKSTSCTLPNLPLVIPSSEQLEDGTNKAAGSSSGIGAARRGDRRNNSSSRRGKLGSAGAQKDSGGSKGPRFKRKRRLPDGTLETLSDEDGEAERQDHQLNMFLANFPESVEHVKLRKQAKNILAGLEDFGDDNTFPLANFSRDLEADLPNNRGGAGYSSTAADAQAAKKKKMDEVSVSGFKLSDQKLRDKFRQEAEVEYADLTALRNQLREDVAVQRALKEAFTTDVHRLSDRAVGDQFAVELTREVNLFAKEHGLTLRQIVQDDSLMEGDIEEVAEGFLDRFWKGKVETRDAGCQVCDEDLGYVDEGVRTVEAHMQDLFSHEQGLVTAIRLVAIAVANIMSFHSSLELESTCKECFYLFDRPRTLWPCGHTFCQQCLAGMYNKRDELICAECGSVCEVGYTPNLSVELIANYQIVQSCGSASGEPESPLNRPGATISRNLGQATAGHAAGQSQTVESVLRTILTELASTQRSCTTSKGMDGMLPIQRL